MERLEAEYPHLLENQKEEMKSKKRKWVEEPEPSEFSFNFF